MHEPPAPDTPVVVAIIDTGIEATEPIFDASAALATPASFPTELPTLRRDLHSATLRTLYAIPETRILGAISFGDHGGPDCLPDARPLWDDCRHGSSVAALVASHAPNAWLVIVEAGGDTSDEVRASLAEALAWVANQDWIDIVNISWQDPIGNLQSSEIPQRLEAVRSAGILPVVSVGNGLGQGLPAARATNSVSSSSHSLVVGSVSECNNGLQFDQTLLPDVLADAGDLRGTSFAAPIVAGVAAAALGEIIDHPRYSRSPDADGWLERRPPPKSAHGSGAPIHMDAFVDAILHASTVVKDTSDKCISENGPLAADGIPLSGLHRLSPSFREIKSGAEPHIRDEIIKGRR